MITHTSDCQCGRCILESLKAVYQTTLNEEERNVIREELAALSEVVEEDEKTA